jgi:hypothetical protein
MDDSLKQLPTEVCVLDIEVWRPLHWQCYIRNGVDIGWHHSEIAFVGIKIFKLEQGDYRPQKCKRFRRRKLSELAQFLSSFSGLIIGYNIFSWDFRMLDRASVWHHFPFAKIVPKTFDIAIYLNDRLGLDELGKINFGEGKREEGRPVKNWQYLKKRKEVYKYNETDCDLTFGLWRHMVFMQEMSVRTKGAFEEYISLIIPDTDMPVLLGQKRQMSFKSWTKLIDQVQENEVSKGVRPLN